MAAKKVKSAVTVRESVEQRKKRMREILKILKREYPEARCSLDFQTPYELLVATVLSAQCTDERVNKVTPELFRHFGTPEKMAKAGIAEIEKLIQSTGFFRNKAKGLSESAKAIVEQYRGEVPSDLESLTKLRGVGRKTANVVLGNAYGVPSIVVDTHVLRVSKRLGFTTSADAFKVEQALMQVIERKDWTEFGHLMIHHGRAICTARRAYCEKCPIARLCPKVGVVIK